MLKADEIPVGSGGSVAPFRQYGNQIRPYLFYCFPLSLVPVASSQCLYSSLQCPKNKCTLPLRLQAHLKSFKNKVFTRKCVLTEFMISSVRPPDKSVCALWSGHFVHNFNSV